MICHCDWWVSLTGPCGWLEFVDLLQAVFFSAGRQALLSFRLSSFLLKHCCCLLISKGQQTLPSHKDQWSLHTKDQLPTPINHSDRSSLPPYHNNTPTTKSTLITIITQSPEKDKKLNSQLQILNYLTYCTRIQSSNSCSLKMPATETGEMLGRKTFGHS